MQKSDGTVCSNVVAFHVLLRKNKTRVSTVPLDVLVQRTRSLCACNNWEVGTQTIQYHAHTEQIKDGKCEHPSSEWNDKVTLTSDGSGEPSSDAGEGDAAAAYAVRRPRDGGGCRYLETAAAAGAGGGQADMSPAGGGGEERAGHARSRS
jgi:hypothetical protein